MVTAAQAWRDYEAANRRANTAYRHERHLATSSAAERHRADCARYYAKKRAKKEAS
jgi:hypothetical protein